MSNRTKICKFVPSSTRTNANSGKYYIVSDITSKDLVKINPSNSELVPLTKRHSDFSLCMDTEEIKQKTETKHLGIKRNNKNNIDIEDRIKLPRRTIYALLGPGLHARRGMSPVVAYKLWKTYVIPRALYGIGHEPYCFWHYPIRETSAENM